jgi:hypothetical protein
MIQNIQQVAIRDECCLATRKYGFPMAAKLDQTTTKHALNDFTSEAATAKSRNN